MSRRSARLAGAVGKLTILAVAAVVLGGAASGSRAILTIRVSGNGAVRIRSGDRVCRHQCRVVGDATITLVSRPAAGNYLLGWSGACSGHARCVVRMTRRRVVVANFEPNGGLVSWNPYYGCKPIFTTIPFLLGSRENARHGATESGGDRQPHLRGAKDKHLLNPPCAVRGTRTFVEIHDVVIAGKPERSADGDETVNMDDPNRPDITDVYMKTIHTEIDHQLIAHNVAPHIQPPQGTHIDIQGFVFWDPANTDARWHSFSGWEIHTLTAWRPAAR